MQLLWTKITGGHHRAKGCRTRVTTLWPACLPTMAAAMTATRKSRRGTPNNLVSPLISDGFLEATTSHLLMTYIDRPEEVSSKRPSASTMPPPSIASLSNKPDQRRKGRDSKTNRNRDKGSKKHNGKGKPASLLEMLLADQIRRERNVILQCIRHARQQNYFQNS
eukprot:TRINITY_DN5979_c0_g1_i1.p2 TRINITY_DN5979_c0_g1~~TRINITY_DN5979_c0_g1_i1.p2  ORF type:complete len:165 (+),score=10.01 TRINITY_DN5979_c0_g1_i1:117-611(+)